MKNICEKKDGELNGLREVINDLEDKNRKLVDKLNQQIMQRVTEYKEKALQALTKTNIDGESPQKRAGRASDARLNQLQY